MGGGDVSEAPGRVERRLLRGQRVLGRDPVIELQKLSLEASGECPSALSIKTHLAVVVQSNFARAPPGLPRPKPRNFEARRRREHDKPLIHRQALPDSCRAMSGAGHAARSPAVSYCTPVSSQASTPLSRDAASPFPADDVVKPRRANLRPVREPRDLWRLCRRHPISDVGAPAENRHGSHPVWKSNSAPRGRLDGVEVHEGPRIT